MINAESIVISAKLILFCMKEMKLSMSMLLSISTKLLGKVPDSHISNYFIMEKKSALIEIYDSKRRICFHQLISHLKKTLKHSLRKQAGVAFFEHMRKKEIEMLYDSCDKQNVQSAAKSREVYNTFRVHLDIGDEQEFIQYIDKLGIEPESCFRFCGGIAALEEFIMFTDMIITEVDSKTYITQEQINQKVDDMVYEYASILDKVSKFVPQRFEDIFFSIAWADKLIEALKNNNPPVISENEQWIGLTKTKSELLALIAVLKKFDFLIPSIDQTTLGRFFSNRFNMGLQERSFRKSPGEIKNFDLLFADYEEIIHYVNK